MKKQRSLPARQRNASMAALQRATAAILRRVHAARQQAPDTRTQPRPRRAARAAPAVTGRRWQDTLIESLIPAHASVLDLGCGDGQLLSGLIQQKGVRGQGVELDPDAVMQCARRGVPVLQANLDEGLQGFSDACFDYVVLEETLQTLHAPLKVLDEMLRVGKQGIVSFPNFGYWRVRLSLAVDGRMPMTSELPYHWHDTPNIHLFTLQDFHDWVKSSRVRVVKAYAMAEGAVRPLQKDDTLFAEESLFVVAR